MGWLIIGIVIGFWLGVWYCRSRKDAAGGSEPTGIESVAEGNGQPANWQDVAGDNGVEDPRLPSSGTPVRPPDD